MNAYRFTITDMDCNEEVRALERELAPLVGKQALRFDTLARIMTVMPTADTSLDISPDLTQKAIMRAVERTGMKAVPLDTNLAGTEPCAKMSPLSDIIHAQSVPHEGAGQAPRAPDLVGHMGCSCCGGQNSALLEKTKNIASLRSMPWGSPLTFDRRTWLCIASGALIAVALLASLADLPQTRRACLLGASALGLYAVLPKAWRAARHLAPDMNLLMIVAVAGALTLGDWLEAATVSFLFALSNLLETWSAGKASRAIQSLLDVTPRIALVLGDETGIFPGSFPNTPENVLSMAYPVADVPVGAHLLVRPGDSVPLDGEILAGNSFVNQAPVTGESTPVTKNPGSPLFAGSINGDGALIMRTTRPAHDSTLARVLRMVEEARSNKARVLQWVEKFAAVYTPIMMASAVALALIPPLFWGGDWSRWAYDALVLLVIACPCALVISTPVCITASLATAARHGVLIKGGVFLEIPAHLDALALDKTGTLTTGEFTVHSILPLNGSSAEAILALAAALENFSSHPVAQAIKNEAARRGLALPLVTNAAAVPGKGATGRICSPQNTPENAGIPHYIGNLRYLEESLGMEAASLAAHAVLEAFHSKSLLENPTDEDAQNAVYLWKINPQNPDENFALGVLLTADTVRPEAARALTELKELGVRDIIMLTGDNRNSAEIVAAQTGVTVVHAELMPEDKARFVAAMVRSGQVVAMVGDGINDAPALASASVSLAMGAVGTDVAIETADIALMADDLTKIPWLVSLARRNLRAIHQNIVFALGVKALFAILAVFGVASLWMAILADVGASLLVIANGMKLLYAPGTPGSTLLREEKPVRPKAGTIPGTVSGREY